MWVLEWAVWHGQPRSNPYGPHVGFKVGSVGIGSPDPAHMWLAVGQPVMDPSKQSCMGSMWVFEWAVWTWAAQMQPTCGTLWGSP